MLAIHPDAGESSRGDPRSPATATAAAAAATRPEGENGNADVDIDYNTLMNLPYLNTVMREVEAVIIVFHFLLSVFLLLYNLP